MSVYNGVQKFRPEQSRETSSNAVILLDCRYGAATVRKRFSGFYTDANGRDSDRRAREAKLSRHLARGAGAAIPAIAAQ